MNDRFESLLDGGRRLLPNFGVPLAALTLLTLGLMAVVDIEPGRAALRVNNITGHQESVTQPGWTLRVPGVHSVYELDAAPQAFSMKGDSELDALHVRQLTVRARDGSNFHFEDITLIFQLIPAKAADAVAHAGTGDRFHGWMKNYARSILRDEFGRETTIDVSDPTTYAKATERSRRRLNEELGPRGIHVAQLVTPRPKFNARYEQAIEERNALGNELQVIRSNLSRAATERQRELADVNQGQNRDLQERRAILESALAEAVAEQAEVTREVDTYRVEQIAVGQAKLSAAEQKARELTGELSAKLDEKRAEIGAFRTQPRERVMQRIAERLQGVTIHIQPYASDATPSRVQLEQVSQ